MTRTGAIVTAVLLILAGIGVNTWLAVEGRSKSETALHGVRRDVSSITSSRRHTIEEVCEDQNRRNQHATARVTALIRRGEARARPAQRLTLRETQAATLSIVDAIIPVEDCAAKVARETRP